MKHVEELDQWMKVWFEVQSSSSNSEEYRADAMRGTNYMQFSYDENGNNDNE